MHLVPPPKTFVIGSATSSDSITVQPHHLCAAQKLKYPVVGLSRLVSIRANRFVVFHKLREPAIGQCDTALAHCCEMAS